MKNYVQLIDRLLERFQINEINFDDQTSCYLLAHLRQLLEQNNIKSTFPVINFYACWALHCELNSNTVSKSVLSTIGSKLPVTPLIDSYFIDVVCENLKFEKLRLEILQLGNTYGFRDVVSDNQRWSSMVGVIANLITDKPLSPPLELAANSIFRINSSNSPLITTPSTLRLWLHGNRGQQLEWSIAIVPDGRKFNILNLSGLQVFNGGVFLPKL